MKFRTAGKSPLLLALMALTFAAGLFPVQPEPAMGKDKKYPPKIVITDSSNPMSGNHDDIEAGRVLYFKFCASCHGERADGVSRFGDYAGNLTAFWRGFGEFVSIVVVGRSKKGMPPWGKYLDGYQISRIGAYLETVAIKGANWK